ncbi:short chain dehydrogenase protein [Rutstroemia sp. NJR-2017a BBW]|nr:short chain dehydrogenase protein [Rutstroemia sp. NJR-2017a BBW]
MSVYVITGASKGIGFGFVKNISEDPKNLVVGLVRDKVGTEKKVAAELGNRTNVHILHGDLDSYVSLKQAAADTAKIVGERGVDYLVANGAYLSHLDAYDPISVSPLYAAVKAALNVIVAKFAAQYKKDGVLFFSISPGVVEVGHYDNVTQEQMKGLTTFMAKIQAYAPHFKGAVSVDEAIQTIRSLWERASIETGYSGAFVSQFGNKQWM